MQGAVGFLVGIAIFAVGLAGLAFGLHEMMTHAAPDGTRAVAGLATFVVAVFASLAVIR